MSNTTIASGVPASFAKREKNDSFTLLQGIALILLTLVVSVGGWYLVGKNYFWTGLDRNRINQQLEHLQEKVKADPKNLEIRVALGYTYFLKGDNKQAIKELNEVLKVNKKYYDAYYNLGLVYLDEDEPDEALEMFQKAIEISPKDYKGYLQKGIVFREMKKYKEAVDTLQKANQLAPRNADIIYQIGLVAEEKGDKDIAIGIYKEALSYDPLYKDAKKALERLQ